jgi:ubiquinone biosynthesis protein COQ9
MLKKKETFSQMKLSKSLNFKQLLLDESLKQATKYGFTKQSILSATLSITESTSSHSIIKPIDLIHYFITLNNNKIQDFVIKEQGTNGKIKELVMNRLLLNHDHIKHYKDALALMLQPQNIQNSSLLLYNLCDEIWYKAGDKSVDLNYYSKRLLLAGVYTSTELFMTSDQSDGYKNTRQFLDRRLNDVGLIGKGMNDLKQTIGFISGQFCSIISSKKK